MVPMCWIIILLLVSKFNWYQKNHNNNEIDAAGTVANLVSLCLCLCLSFCLHLCVCVCLCLSISLSQSVFLCLSVCLCLSLYDYLSLFVCLSLSAHSMASTSVLFPCLCPCLHVCVSTAMCFSPGTAGSSPLHIYRGACWQSRVLNISILHPKNSITFGCLIKLIY